jgi:taurine dioxygenase
MPVATLAIRELKPGFGAEILDLDVAGASARDRAGVVDAFQRHGAILLRDQKLTPDDLMSFIAAFGEAEGHTLEQFTLPGYPKIYILSNRVANGAPIGAHNDGVGWHTDYSYKARPVMCTMLYAMEVPTEGSDTLLADGCAAWNALPPARQAQLEGLELHHSYQHFMATRQYNAMELPEEIKRDNPDVIHPLVRTHPANGRKALWPSTGTVIEVVGMPNPEGLELVEELVEFMTQDRFVYRHKWKVGDLLMWDNRCTLHTGTLYDDQKYFRTMYRMWVAGDRPR